MKRTIVFTIFIFFTGFIFYSCKNQQLPEKKIKYVFYFIGDGMGLAQIHATEIYLAALDSSNNFPFLNMNKLPHQTYCTTHAKNRYITGSAAAGTALASGQKTSINTIGKNADRTENLISVSVKAKLKGMKVGIISSVGIDHATPASFYAHQDSRNMYYEIGLDLVNSGFDFFGGTGFRYPIGRNNDRDTNLISFAKENGYHFVEDKDEFIHLQPSDNKYIVINETKEGNSSMPYRIDQGEEIITLPEFLSNSIELLDNENGFFVMLEGGKIDWACHQNDAVAAIHDIIAFDEAVGVALEFYKMHPDETIILVTADHETGGLSIGNALTGYETDYTLLNYQKSSMDVLVEKFENIENLSFESAMEFARTEFSLDDTVSKLKLTDYDIKRLKKAFKALENPELVGDKYELYDLYGGYNPFVVEAMRIFYGKAGISFTTWAHTGIPVPLRYIGFEPCIFDGFVDNTTIVQKIEEELFLDK